MSVNAKGSRREREFLDLLNNQGYVVHRVAGSGTKDSAICDLVAVKNGKAHFVEVKSRKKVFYSKEHLPQLELMKEHAKKAKAVPILAVKLNYKPWQVINISKKIPTKIN